MSKIVLETHRDLEKINSLLQIYKGYPIKLWDYTVSLSQLHLRIERGAAGNFHLMMVGVDSIISPKLYWQLDGQIEYDKSNRWFGYIFKDESNSISINCSGIRLEENVEPLYS